MATKRQAFYSFTTRRIMSESQNSAVPARSKGINRCPSMIGKKLKERAMRRLKNGSKSK
jgi:hypothetical protein